MKIPTDEELGRLVIAMTSLGMSIPEGIELLANLAEQAEKTVRSLRRADGYACKFIEDAEKLKGDK